MEFEQLRALIAVVDAGSILGASKAVNVTRSRLRTQLKALEDELGVRLITRSARGVEATETGEHFMKRARALIRAADELRRETSDPQRSALRELRMCVPTGIPPIATRIILAGLREAYPQLALRLLTHPDPIAMIDRSVDVIVHFGEPVTSGSFRTFVMRKFALRLMASKVYLDRRGWPRTVGDLAGHSLLLWTAGGAHDERLVLRGPDGFEWSPWFSSPDCYLVRTAAAEEHGIALLPDALAGEAGRPGPSLELVLPQGVVFERSVRVLLPENKADTARVRAVAEVLRSVGRWVSEHSASG